MALEAPLDPTQRTAMELEIGEKEDGVNEPREITELMNDLTELDESIRNQDRDLAALEAGGNEEITPKAPSSESDTMPFYEQICEG